MHNEAVVSFHGDNDAFDLQIYSSPHTHIKSSLEPMLFIVHVMKSRATELISNMNGKTLADIIYNYL